MSKRPYKKENRTNGSPKRTAMGASSPKTTLGMRRSASGDHWVFVHPRNVLERAEDMEEVQLMIESGEPGLAMDELLWLVSECHEFMDAHRLLGELAMLIENDLDLARGHYAFAYNIGLKALKRAGNPTPVPFRQPANQPFFEAGVGLATCLTKLGKVDLALEIREQLLKCDPEFPMGCDTPT